ncbi:MAG: TolC family protein, partial [Crocosphaera sp.]
EQFTNNTNSELPCLDTTNPCVEQLTQQAIATSLTLQTLNERITLIDDRLALMGDRKDYAESKLWTNYLPTTTNIDGIIDPFAWIRNLAGGGDMQRDRLAIADLEVKAATLEAARAELEKQREQEKVNLGEKVLQLLLNYEAATRQVELVESQVKTFQVSREAFRIRYKFGEGTTEQLLSFEERGNKLNEQLMIVKTRQEEAVRELRQLVGVN